MLFGIFLLQIAGLNPSKYTICLLLYDRFGMFDPFPYLRAGKISLVARVCRGDQLACGSHVLGRLPVAPDARRAR